MQFDKTFQLISKAVKKEKISCLLIGGFAINYYQVSRQTLDMDFLVTAEGLEKLKPLLQRAGYREIFLQEVFARFTHEKKNNLDLDFLFVDPETLNKMVRAGKKIRLAGADFYIPSLEHLLALKLHAMKSNPGQRLYKDLPDIINLILMNKINYQTIKFKTLCLKYADQKIYHAIVESLKNHG